MEPEALVSYSLNCSSFVRLVAFSDGSYSTTSLHSQGQVPLVTCLWSQTVLCALLGGAQFVANPTSVVVVAIPTRTALVVGVVAGLVPILTNPLHILD